MKNLVEIPLEGNKESLSNLFGYSDSRFMEEQTDGTQVCLTTLATYMAQFFDQMLYRDEFYGGWAQVLLNDKGDYILKMYCENQDLEPYEVLVPEMLSVSQVGYEIYKEKVVGEDVECPIVFLLPFGLSAAKTKSVQLLHYPPLESQVYTDYLYSPTNRRWENLLTFNGIEQIKCAELETIVDIVPLAAPGDDGALLGDFTNTFSDYVKQMLQIKMKPLDAGNGKKVTMPIVAYGGSVQAWLNSDGGYKDQIDEYVTVMTLLSLDINGDGSSTPVLCGNHPSKYLYYTETCEEYNALNPKDKNVPYTEEKYWKTKLGIMSQDLITAGWQVKMSQDPTLDPQAILDELTEYYNTNTELVEKIMVIQDKEYSYDGLTPEVPIRIPATSKVTTTTTTTTVNS